MPASREIAAWRRRSSLTSLSLRRTIQGQDRQVVAVGGCTVAVLVGVAQKATPHLCGVERAFDIKERSNHGDSFAASLYVPYRAAEVNRSVAQASRLQVCCQRCA